MMAIRPFMLLGSLTGLVWVLLRRRAILLWMLRGITELGSFIKKVVYLLPTQKLHPHRLHLNQVYSAHPHYYPRPNRTNPQDAHNSSTQPCLNRSISH